MNSGPGGNSGNMITVERTYKFFVIPTSVYLKIEKIIFQCNVSEKTPCQTIIATKAISDTQEDVLKIITVSRSQKPCIHINNKNSYATSWIRTSIRTFAS